MIARAQYFLVVAAVLLLTTGLLIGRYAIPAHSHPSGVRVDVPGGGVAYLPKQTYDEMKAEQAQAEAQHALRQLLPALEQWNVEHGGYTGATVAKLRHAYDSSLTDVGQIVRASATDYCLQSSAGGYSYRKRGPTQPIEPGSC